MSSSSPLCSRSVPWLGEGLCMLLPHLPILRYPPPVGTGSIRRLSYAGLDIVLYKNIPFTMHLSRI